MDLAASMLRAFEGARKRFPVALTYRRGGDEVQLVAVAGSTRTDLDTTNGSQVRSYIQDFKILASELVLNGQRTLPQAGDQVKDEAHEISELFKLPGEPAYRWSDPTKQILRIHVQFYGKAP